MLSLIALRKFVISRSRVRVTSPAPVSSTTYSDRWDSYQQGRWENRWASTAAAALALLVVLSSPAPATAQELAPLRLPTTVYFLGAGADVSSQLYASHWGGREANPTIAWLEPKVGIGGTLAIGEAIDVGAVWALEHWLGKRHPKALKWALYGGAGLRFYIAGENVRKGNQYRRYVQAGGLVVDGRAVR